MRSKPRPDRHARRRKRWRDRGWLVRVRCRRPSSDGSACTDSLTLYGMCPMMQSGRVPVRCVTRRVSCRAEPRWRYQIEGGIPVAGNKQRGRKTERNWISGKSEKHAADMRMRGRFRRPKDGSSRRRNCRDAVSVCRFLRSRWNAGRPGIGAQDIDIASHDNGIRIGMTASGAEELDSAIEEISCRGKGTANGTAPVPEISPGDGGSVRSGDAPPAEKRICIDDLRSRVLESLKAQGFELTRGRLIPPDPRDKNRLRVLHREAVSQCVSRSRTGLARHEDRLLTYVAAGREVDPSRIRPKLVQVEAESEEELLFRYAKLHWSIPVSAGYGRRLRFVVMDESNGKLVGLFGLGDPVFGLRPRDQWIGWGKEARTQRLKCVMDLFALGAVPPYSRLLCGKLVALLALSTCVEIAFMRKYDGRKSIISGRRQDGRLALLTTTSALGRSSLYNRLRRNGRPLFESVGYTRGSGEFHFSNGLYEELRELARARCDPTAKHRLWGAGFRNRRELVRKALPLLGLPRQFSYHGVERQVFVAPLAQNSKEFLRGEEQDLTRFERSPEELFSWFRDRWLLPRAERDSRYREFDPAEYRIFKSP